MTEGTLDPSGEAHVRFDVHRGRGRFRIGLAHLAREARMNALSAGMCEAMLAQFRQWATDDSIACVVLDGDGGRAFCAGGDVVAMARSIRAGGPERYAYSDRGFAAEYALVQAIFEYPKPFVSWAHGMTMGAGFGLAAAASHRVVAPTVRMAMPESRIGLFPDVGATWFLGRVPGNAGPLIALAGVVLGAADALRAGLAEWLLPESAKAEVHAQLAAAPFSGDARRDHALVARVLGAAEEAGTSEADAAHGDLVPRFRAIRRIGAARTVADFRSALAREADGDPWFALPLEAVDAGSPTSIHVGFEHFRRGRGRSLRETLATDLVLARAFVRGHDYPEGVRAALLDRDRRPRWQPASLAEVSAAAVDACFRAD